MQVTLCDWCPTGEQLEAQYRMSTIALIDKTPQDAPIDLCHNHYGELLDYHRSHGVPQP